VVDMNEKEAVGIGRLTAGTLWFVSAHLLSPLVDKSTEAIKSKEEFKRFLSKISELGGNLPEQEEVQEISNDEKLRIAFMFGFLSVLKEEGEG
jgi:hypothetical protein